MKVCRTCNESKHLKEFPKSKVTLDGHKVDCNKCTLKASSEKYRQSEKGKEKRREAQSRYRRGHKDEVKGSRSEWAKDNPIKDASYRVKRANPELSDSEIESRVYLILIKRLLNERGSPELISSVNSKLFEIYESLKESQE